MANKLLDTMGTGGASESPSAVRLKAALETLARQVSAGTPGVELSAVTLCQHAKVSRTALYRYHRDILNSLKLLKQEESAIERRQSNDIQLEDENKNLRVQIANLAALVDHYYRAWEESQTLLSRRDRELSELRRQLNQRPLPLRKNGAG